MRIITLFPTFLLLIVITLLSCTDEKKRNITREELINNAPVLTPKEFMNFTYLEDGFELQLIAAEPHVVSPIAMTFDEKNRIWAVEMTGYMPNVDGEGEEVPNGKIVILEDKNNDGYYESRTVFLDSLLLPRAIALIKDGILVAEPPNLWYYDIVNDKPRNKKLIDPEYTVGNNVEAQSNGIFRAIDNWFYNAGSNKRYKKIKHEWVIDTTHRRGQWGITQDDQGRLFYNNNSQNLLGDYFLPDLGSLNPSLTKVTGFNEQIVSDNRTYPSRPTPGVNRGYMQSVLDDSLKLKTFTAACGPVIYRGDLFDTEYYQNAFVAEPAANLIKRNILTMDGNTVTGSQAYVNKEFLASDDERFRPTSLYNGPDGALYITDMYHGIIQHKLFLTKYLKDEITKRNLEKPLNCGRIYKIVPIDSKSKIATLPQDPIELAKLLKDKNAWSREKAQQILVDTNPLEIKEYLWNTLDTTDNKFEFTHILWTLKGMESISNEQIVRLIIDENNEQKLIQLFTALDKIPDNSQLLPPLYSKTTNLTSNTILAPYLAFKIGIYEEIDNKFAEKIRSQILNNFPHSKTIAHALISNSHGKEDELKESLKRLSLKKNAVVFEEIENHLKKIKETNSTNKDKVLREKYGRGISLYKTTCQPCHGNDGAGIEFLAPPLNNSEWVTGDKEKLISIVLYGLSGPITVNNKEYTVPDISGEMPGIINNPELVESDLALLLSYIRNNWNNKASDVDISDIEKVKSKWKDRSVPFTQEELLKN